MQGVLSGMHASRAAEHHWMTIRGLGDLPQAQPPKIWKQFGDLCIRIVRDPLTSLLPWLMCHTEQCMAVKFVPRLLSPDQKELCAESFKISISVPWITQPSCQGSSLGMRHVSMGTTYRPTNSLCSGRAQHLHDRRTQDRSVTICMFIGFF